MPGKHILETLENLLLILKKSLIIQFPQPINDPNLTQVLKTSYSTSLFKDIYLLELSLSSSFRTGVVLLDCDGDLLGGVGDLLGGWEIYLGAWEIFLLVW